jgi:D-alanyl-D-alanine carboxypeptidase
MSESNFVNPNGLPADGQITSARDLAILARALIREFPDYSFYWHVPAIKFGRRIVRNYNPLLGRYPGADGMKTGFICASGFNLVATATRNNKHLIAVVLGAPSGAVRAIKAAEMLESGFSQNPLSWLTPSLGMVDALAPMDVAPPNLAEQTCGKHRKRPAAEDEDMDADSDNSQAAAAASESRSLLLSALRAPTNPVLLSDLGPVMPVVVYTGPTRSPSQLATLSSDVAADPDNTKKKTKHKATAARSTDDQAAPEPPANKKSVVAKPTDDKPTDAKATAKPTDTKTTTKKPAAGAGPWTPTSPSALAASPPPELKTTSQASAPAAAPKKQAKPKPPVEAPPAQ